MQLQPRTFNVSSDCFSAMDGIKPIAKNGPRDRADLRPLARENNRHDNDWPD